MLGSKKKAMLYRPVGWIAGAGAGLVAGLAFKQVWRMVGGDEDAPDALDERRGWTEILMAAALQGAIFAVVKAAVDRASAQGVREVTGHWPG